VFSSEDGRFQRAVSEHQVTLQQT